MPSLIAKEMSQAVSAATSAGNCTVTSTADMWPGQIGFLSKTAVTSVRVTVVSIPDATHFIGRLTLKIDDPGFGPLSHPTMTGGSDLSAFNGGSATFSAPEQLVAVNADYSKLAR